MSEALRKAIHSGDRASLERLVREDPRLLEASVGLADGTPNAVPPLHLVCDAVARGLLAEERALELASLLLEAGVDPARIDAKTGDDYLIAAASLGVERVGLRLVEHGLDVRRRGLFGATALHWAALQGLERLTRALLAAGAEVEARDTRYDATPLGWALHGWRSRAAGQRGGIARVAGLLVGLGARVPFEAAHALAGEDDRELRAALGVAGPERGG